VVTATGTAGDLPVRGEAGAIAPVRTRRSWVYAAGAAALIIVGGVASVFIYSTSLHTQQVFVIAKSIDRGDTITKDDLTTIDVAAGQRTDGVAAADSSSLIGKVATVDLPKGSLLTRSAVASALPVPDGQALVGLSLKPAQLPSQQLVAGDRIEIVPIAATDGAAAARSNSAPVQGTVSASRTSQASGTTVVDVYINARNAADVTSRAAAGQVAVYLAAAED